MLYVIENSGLKLSKNELTSESNLKSRQLRKRTLYLLELIARFLIVMVSLGRGDISRSASAKVSNNLEDTLAKHANNSQ